MSRSTITTSGNAGRVVWVYQTRGCGVVTPEEFRRLLRRFERQLGRPLEAEDVPWEFEIIGEFALEVGADAADEDMADLGVPSRWGYCDCCGERGGNAEAGDEGHLVFVCQRCETVFADPWADQLLYA